MWLKKNIELKPMVVRHVQMSVPKTSSQDTIFAYSDCPSILLACIVNIHPIIHWPVEHSGTTIHPFPYGFCFWSPERIYIVLLKFALEKWGEKLNVHLQLLEGGSKHRVVQRPFVARRGTLRASEGHLANSVGRFFPIKSLEKWR